MNVPTRVLIVSDDCMGGHAAAARAVRQALSASPLHDRSHPVEAKFVDFFDTSSAERQQSKREWNPAYMDRDRARKIYQQFSKPSFWLKLKWQNRVWKGIHAGCPQAGPMVADEEPDIILSAHMDTNAMSKGWQAEGKLRAPVHCVVTDFVGIYAWVQNNIKRYYVATEDVKKDLQRFGVKADRIQVTGIPISSHIAAPDERPRAAVKASLGLDPNKPVILILGGSQGDQKYQEILTEMARQGNQAQVVTVSGRNEKQRAAIEKFATDLNFPVDARGYVDLRDYYHVADVVVTKPGGLTAAELMAKGKAMVATAPYAGMEEAQLQRLVKAGVARSADSPAAAAKQAVELLTDTPARERLEQKARAYGRPDAAQSIAEDLLRSSGVWQSNHYRSVA